MTTITATAADTLIQEAEVKAKAVKWEDFYTDRYEGQDDAEELTWTERCGKCSGTGHIRAFGHVDGGICYDCFGRNSTYQVDSTVGKERAKARKRAQSAAGAQRKAIRKLAKLEAARGAEVAAWAAKYPVLGIILDTRGERLEQVLGLEGWKLEAATNFWMYADRGQDQEHAERAAIILVEALNRRQVKDAQAAGWTPVETRTAVPVGKGQEVTGTVLGFKYKEAFTYGGTGTWKAVVEEDRGFKVYVTVPSKTLTEVGLDDLKGKRITAKMTLERSDRDEFFGFGKNPRPFTLLGE